MEATSVRVWPNKTESCSMKFAILSPLQKSLETVSDLLKHGDPSRVIAQRQGNITAMRAVAEQEHPDVFIVEGVRDDTADLSQVEFISMQYPNMFIIMLSADQSSALLMKAMQAGVREVLPWPVPLNILEAAIFRAESKVGRRATRRTAPVIAFIACKGGSGATFLATNVGFQLGEAGKKVLLIDLNLQFGEAILTVHDRKPTSDIVQVAQNLSRLDALFLSASVTQITPSYFILAAPDDPVQSLQVKPEHLDAILNLAVTEYDFVILDLGMQLDDLTIKALDRASKVFLVVQTLLPYVRNASRMMSVFRSLGYPAEKLEVLVNRFWKHDEISLDALRASLGVEKLRTIPNSYKEVSKAINLGVPLASISKTNTAYRAVVELTESLLPRPVEAPAGLLSRLLSF